MESPQLTWLNEQFVQKVLRNAEENESIEVSNIVVKAATKLGDNYGSWMLRISVEMSRLREDQQVTEKRSILAKITPNTGILKEMLENGYFFETEISMMSETLPKMMKLLQELEAPQLAANCLYVQREKPTHLIFEDLRPKGFVMADHEAKGLDLDHSLLVVRNLALFHASSVALKEKLLFGLIFLYDEFKEPTAMSNYNLGIFQENTDALLITFYKESTKSLGEAIAQWPELDPRMSEKLIKLSETIFGKTCEVVCYRDDDFNVLNHGDCWVNNMLFRYDEQQKPVAQIFVDFQTSYYGSAALDLHYFLCSSTSYDVRLNHQELLLREYHKLLTSTMAKLKCNTEAPSFDKLQEILNRRMFYQLPTVFAGLPVILSHKKDAKTMEEIMAPGEKSGHQGELFRKIITRNLRFYDSMGLLD